MARGFQLPIWTLSIILASAANVCLAGLNVTHEWKFVDYVWRSECQKELAVDNGYYDLTKIIIQDVQPLSDGRVLVTTPKYNANPASLSLVSEETGAGGPLLAPYPNWHWHEAKDCSGITSTSRVILDDYNRLWLVDSGRIGNEQICPAKILVFETETDQLLLSFGIPSKLLNNPYNEKKGLLEILEVKSSADLYTNTWVYVSDLEGYGVLVSNVSSIWRLDRAVFRPNPNNTTFSIAGDNFTLNIGTTGVLAPDNYLEEPYLIFKPLSSVRAHAVSLEDLHNSQSCGSDITFWTSEFVGTSQETARTFTKEGILIAAFPTETTIACWNIENPLQLDYIAFLETNSTIYQYVSGIKNLEGTVYITSNRLQKFILGNMNFDEINFRVMEGNIDDLVKGTVCEPSKNPVLDASIEEKGFHPYDGIS